MKHAVITSIDKRYGNFLIQHWLVSLKKNVSLHMIDIVVLDYGLTPSQLDLLQQEKVTIVPCTKRGHIVNNRFEDAARFLKSKTYNQILFVDGGDIIFQKDTSFLFNQNTDTFRLVRLDLEVLFYETFIPFHFWGIQKKMYSFLKNKPVLNAGFILAPQKKFINLCNQINNVISAKHAYGPDQVALNYFIQQENVKLLDNTYNFMITATGTDFYIKEGEFYFTNGKKIAVVHNAGHNRYLRPIKNFGYGSSYNKLNAVVYLTRRAFFKFIGLVKSVWFQ